MPQKRSRLLRNCLVTAVLLSAAAAASLLYLRTFEMSSQITDIFTFAVFLIAILTDGYWYGGFAVFLIAILTDGYWYGGFAALVGMFAVNFVFLPPFFGLDFVNNRNLVSSVSMLTIAFATGMLTSKLKIQEQLRAESQLERMRANLLRAVSHDLRTPLTTLYSASSTLLENRETLTPAQQETILKSIQQDSAWLVGMVENLLSVTRLDQGAIRLLKTPTVVDELLDAVLAKFHRHYPQQPVEVSLPQDLMVVPMDATLIQQVLMNLLENAMLHARGMTRLTLRVFPQGELAVFRVEDDGCGLPPDRLKRLFAGPLPAQGQPQPVDSQKRSAGIGLSVCATIIKAHDGKITARNNREGGLTVEFTLRMEEDWDDPE